LGLKTIDLINDDYCFELLVLSYFYFSVRLAEGEQILTGGVLNKQKSQDDIISEFGDSACFTLALLGQIYWYVEIVYFVYLP